MEFSEAFQALESYPLWLFIVGLAVLSTTVLPRVLAKYPFSMSISLLGVGYAAIALPLGLEAPDPLAQGVLAEHLTEIGVIVALMGAGLKIDRIPNVSDWEGAWRLLGITMVLTIAMTALVGWWLAAFAPPTAMLLGACIAPTDPVLASEVEVGSPGQGAEDAVTEDTDETGLGEEDEVRFSLTAEAGLNDGLAFPFTNVAIAMAVAGTAPANWIVPWLVVDVFYKIVVACIVGLLLGYALARGLMAMPATTPLAQSMLGLGALAATLILYGGTEFVDGYGFLATFIGALTIRHYERTHDYHETLHIFSEQAERLLMAGILIAFGGALADGLLEPLTWPLVGVALIIVLVIRPLAGIIGFVGFDRAPWRERLFIATFGIRGIGSLYYLAHAMNEAEFAGAEQLWALVGLVILISVIGHGITAAPLTEKLDALREQSQEPLSQPAQWS